LSDDDILAAIQTIRKNLAPNGSIAFESRNPAIDWAKAWSSRPSSIWKTDTGEMTMSTRVHNVNGERLSFEHYFQFPDETLSSPSTLRFTSRDDICGFLDEAGLQVAKLFGNWDMSSFDERTSPEMIFVVDRKER
jgi:hypothetical protein